MEIELTAMNKLPHPRAWAAVLLVPVLLGLGWLGVRYTQVGADGYPVLMSWGEWQVVQARQVYTAELESLRQEAEGLALLLDQGPDPVRAQITAERITQAYAEGQPALAYQRELLVTAAGAVEDWSAGALPVEQAQAALRLAVKSLDPGVGQP